MAVLRVQLWDAEGLKLAGDSFFLYTAYCPMSEGQVLVKVGISTIPYQRFVAIHCNSPFPVEFAAFTVIGGQKSARNAEIRILGQFEQYKTRGEWLLLPNNKESKKVFSTSCNAVITLVTGKPVLWTKVSGDKVKAYMNEKMHKCLR